MIEEKENDNAVRLMFIGGKKEKNIKCPTPGCDGRGNTNLSSKGKHHRTVQYCPIALLLKSKVRTLLIE